MSSHKQVVGPGERRRHTGDAPIPEPPPNNAPNFAQIFWLFIGLVCPFVPSLVFSRRQQLTLQNGQNIKIVLSRKVRSGARGERRWEMK